MTASWLSSANAPPRKCVPDAPPAITGLADPAANAPLPVPSMKSMPARNFPDRLMSATAARNAVNAPWKSGCTGFLCPKRIRDDQK